MSHVTASISTHTEAVLTALREGTDDEVRVGDHIAPKDAEGPYCVVYVISGGGSEGSLCDPYADVTFIWQVTSVGRTAAEARWVADQVRVALDGVTLEVADRVLRPLRLVTTSPGLTREDSVKSPLFHSYDRFTTVSTPA